ncbi:MAG TPA: class I SAM-dependent methyltransferase [Hanamia sp.]|nr:class I SAM-dependent methyltransferase [Hanamia sp.]
MTLVNPLSKIKSAKIFKRKNSHKLSGDEFYKNFFVENKAWNKASPNYDENLRWSIIEKFLYFIKGYHTTLSDHSKSNILDVGCGRGWLSNLLSEHGNIIGIEPVGAVVEYGRRLFPCLDLRIGTTQSLIDKGYSLYFDIIVCSEVIEHIADDQKEAFLNEIKRLLKTNGFLILTTPRKDAEAEWKRYGDPEQPIENWFSEESLAKLLSRTGFQTHLLKRLSMPPLKRVPEIEIYQLWLAQKI